MSDDENCSGGSPVAGGCFSDKEEMEEKNDEDSSLKESPTTTPSKTLFSPLKYDPYLISKKS